MKTIHIKKFLLLLVPLILASCNFEGKNRHCEAFNLNLINYNKSFKARNLKYTDGVDTLELKLSNYFCSNQSYLDPFSNPECTPRLTISYEDSKHILKVCNSFNYSKEENKMEYSILINSSSFEIDYDEVKKLKSFTINQFKNWNNNDSSRLVSSVKIDEMIISKIEFKNGKIWKRI